MISLLRNPRLRLLFAIIAVCLAVTAYLRVTLDFNAPYMDECDYLFVGRLYLEGKDWGSQAYIFGSDISLYILGIFDTLGGYIPARAMAAFLGVLSLFFFFKYAQELLKNTGIAIFSTIILSLAAPHIFISKYATYDIICYVFFTASLWVGLQGLRSHSLKTTLLATLLFLLAVLTKYVAIGYAPFLFLVVFVRNKRNALIAAGFFAALLGLYILANFAELKQLYFNHIIGSHQGRSTYWQVLQLVFRYTALLYILAFFAIIFKKNFPFKDRSLWTLLMLSLPIILYHLRSRDLISACKHMVYPATFLAPIAGAMFTTLLKANFRPRVVKLLPYFALPALALIGFFQTREMENSFPDTRNVVAFLKDKITPQTRIISEDSYLFRYYFYPKLSLKNLPELGYHDNNMDGKFEEQDVVDAVWEGKFDYVFLTGQITPELTRKLREGVLPNSYVKIFSEPFKNSEAMRRNASGNMEIYGLKSVFKK
ncbi:MAG: glycosyltransferase family 39 protein [Bacteroidota bacterium]